jgi:L-lactate dehydrogenase
MLMKTIAIIGAGSVGATLAYTLTLKNAASRIMLIDVNEQKEEGEVMDINDALPLVETGSVVRGDIPDAAQADVIVLTAGTPQKSAEESRLELVNRNRDILRSIFQKLGTPKPSAVIMVVANPVDILTFEAQRLSGLPASQVFGTGTALDTARLCTEIGLALNVSPASVSGYVLGEHGDSEFVAWSTVHLSGVRGDVLLDATARDTIEQAVRNQAYEIISRKGSTFYGIAAVAADIIEAILFDQHKVLVVSSLLNTFNGVSGVCLGAPAVIGAAGVEKIWPLELPDDERAKFQHSADTIRQFLG